MAVGAFVNADVIARGLSAFDSESVAFQAGRIMLDRLRELASQRAEFAFETTLASRTFAPFIQRLRESGYLVQLVYVWLNTPSLCVERVRQRFRTGGHFVDEETVRRRYERSLMNFFRLYRPLADDWRVYDNSLVTGSRVVAEGNGVAMARVYQQATWNEMRRRAGV
jgi:predicted ABC-type ATPase